MNDATMPKSGLKSSRQKLNTETSSSDDTESMDKLFSLAEVDTQRHEPLPHCSYPLYPSPPRLLLPSNDSPSTLTTSNSDSDSSTDSARYFPDGPKKATKRRHSSNFNESQTSRVSSDDYQYVCDTDSERPSSLFTRSTQTVDTTSDRPAKRRAPVSILGKFTSCFSRINGQWTNTSVVPVEKPLVRPAQTPLEIPLLLNMIFDYLPLEDIKNCRLVSSEWRVGSLSRLSKFRLNINSMARLNSLMSYHDVWKYECKRSRNIFTNVELPNDVSMKHVQLNRFLEKYGAHIKSIVIPNNGWTMADLRVVLFTQLPFIEEVKLIGDVPTDNDSRLTDGLPPDRKLTKLKRLFLHFTNAQEKAQPVIHLQGFFNSGTNPWTKRLISDLLWLSPNLEVVRCSNKRDMLSNPELCFKIANQVKRPAEDIAQSFSRVNQFLAQKLFSRMHDSTPKLVNLDLYLRLNDRGMQKLEMKHYPLEALDLHVRYMDKKSLITLLESLGKTLKFLRLRMDRFLPVDFSCTFFEKLETLHLEEYAGQLTFLGEIRSLKTLTLDRFECKRFTRKDFTPCIAHSKVSKLSIVNLKPPEKQGKCIKRLAILLPNIRDFSLDSARDSDLLRVFDSMPLLEHLRLNSESISTTGLSGHTEADTERILDSGYELSKFNEYEARRRLPYIGDLKNLKTLALEGDLSKLTPYCMQSRMIPHMHGLWVLHGVCSLKHLRRLIIHNATLSSLEIKQIIKQMDLIRLELQSCQIDDPMPRWIKKKTFGKPFQFVVRKKEDIVVHPPLALI